MEAETEIPSWELRRRRHNEWLAAIKVGDKCVVAHQRTGKSVLTVTRMTKTQILAVSGWGDECRFRRDTGHTVGSGYGSLLEYTQEVRDELELANLKKWLVELPKEKFTLEQLRALYVAVKKISATGDAAMK